LIVAAYEHIWESSDGGASWTDSPLNDEMQYINCVESFGQRLYVGGNAKIAISGVGGNGFVIKNLPVGVHPENITVFGSLTLVYDLLSERFYRSLNDGDTWQASSLASFGNSGHKAALFNGLIYTLHDGTLAYSDNQGLNWTTLPNQPASNVYMNFVAAHNGALIVADYVTGALRAGNHNGPWADANNGLVNSSVRRIALTSEYLFAGADYRGLFRYDLAAGEWDTTRLLLAQYNFGDLFVRDDKVFVALGYQNAPNQFTVGVSSDGGDNWTALNSPGLFDLYSYNRINGSSQSLIIYSDEPAGLPEAPIQKSDNEGASWYLLMPVFSSQIDSTQLRCFATDGDKIWAGTSRGVAYSPNNGATWTEKNNGLLGSSGIYNWPVSSVFVVDSLVFAQRTASPPTIGQLYVSSDQGSNWEPATSGLPLNYYSGGPYVGGIVRFDGNLVASTNDGLYFSKDEGRHWARHPVAQPDNVVTAMLLRDSLIYIGTGNRGVWRGKAADFSIEKVSGRVYWDDNNNGVQDAGEKGVQGMIVSLGTTHPTVAQTDSLGDYEIYAHFDGSTYTIKPFNSNLPHTTVVPGFYEITAAAQGLHFGLSKTPGIRDLSVQITSTGAPRPGFEFKYYVHARNQGTTLENALVEFVGDPALEFVSATPMPDQTSGDTLRWLAGNMGYLENRQFEITMKVPASTPLGTTLYGSSAVTPADNDVSPANNNAVETRIVVGSYDPNDKKELHEGVITRQQLAGGEALEYTIRFQNTGTYPAEKVVITDKLDPALDPTTLRIIGASHNFTWSLRGESDLEFVFDMIHLPDSSSDQAGSNGFVKFAVQVRNAVPNAYAITNAAAIYFDFNSPIITKNCITTVQEPTLGTSAPAEKRPALKIAPNPGSEWFTLSWPEAVKPAGWVQVFSQNGQLIQQKKAADAGSMTLNLGDQPDGAYFVIMADQTGRLLTGKILLLRR
jgi:uncharacterized repeat protein (TIGR01451 family)